MTLVDRPNKKADPKSSQSNPKCLEALAKASELNKPKTINRSIGPVLSRLNTIKTRFTALSYYKL